MNVNDFKPNYLRIFSALTAIGIFLFVLNFSLNRGNNISTQDARNNQQNYPVTVQGVQVNTKPTRIVVLSPLLSDALSTLKYNDIIVGRALECSASAIPKATVVGSETSPDIEKIKSLQPELVLIEKPLSAEVVNDLKGFEIKVVTFHRAQDFMQFGKLYTNIGSLLGGANDGYKSAAKCANGIYLSVMDINKLIPQEGEYFTACYMYDTQGTVASGDTLSDDLIQVSGARDIAAKAENFNIDINSIIEADPTYIFCKPGMLNKIKQDSRFSNMKAVRESNIYEMDSRLIEAQDDKIIDAVTFMASVMYPELVTRES